MSGSIETPENAPDIGTPHESGPPVPVRMPAVQPVGETPTEEDRGMEERREPTSSAGARALISELLRRCVRDTTRVRGDAHLAATELIGNALTHGGGLTGFRAELNPEATQLCLQVEDASPEPPHAAVPADPALPGGRGWAIVKRLATTCSVALLPSGKRITVTLAI